MSVYRGDPALWNPSGTSTAVAIGVFDGVHRGHVSVIRGVMEHAGDRPSYAMTFDTHPREVVSGSSAPPALAPLERRIELLRATGVSGVAVIEFTEVVRRMAPEDFVRSYLVDGLNAAVVAIGSGFRFGYQARGDVELLRALGQEHGFEVLEMPIVDLHGTEIRSSAIRAAIASGDVALAADMLGRPFEIEGMISAGDSHGRTIGYATSLITMPDCLVHPATGVYAIRCVSADQSLIGVCNVGTRPTFGGSDEAIEVHLLDVSAVGLGDRVRVEFIDRLRNEQRFAAPEALVFQIKKDIAQAREILEP